MHPHICANELSIGVPLFSSLLAFHLKGGWSTLGFCTLLPLNDFSEMKISYYVKKNIKWNIVIKGRRKEIGIVLGVFPK